MQASGTPLLPLSTPAAARALGVTYHRLIGLLRFGRIEPPQKNASGDYCWYPQDLERAAVVLAARRAQEVAL